MPLNMSIEITSGVSVTEVPEDIAADLAEAYEALSKLPVNRQVVVDFPDAAAARLFCRQGKSWAANHLDAEGNAAPLTFARKGNVKENPTRVAFRIYVPRPGESETDAE